MTVGRKNREKRDSQVIEMYLELKVLKGEKNISLYRFEEILEILAKKFFVSSATILKIINQQKRINKNKQSNEQD